MSNGSERPYICRHGMYRSEHVCDDHLDHDRERDLTARAEMAEELGAYDRRRADALAASIREAQAAALRDAAKAIEAATPALLEAYGTEHAETARVAIVGCVDVLRKRADAAAHA